jgi:hypothetical protein
MSIERTFSSVKHMFFSAGTKTHDPAAELADRNDSDMSLRHVCQDAII